jgi:hypothetical protein
MRLVITTFRITTLPLCLVLRFIYYYAECRHAESPYPERHYAECSYAECLYAECRGTLKKLRLRYSGA